MLYKHMLAQVHGKVVQGGKTLHVSPKTTGSKNPNFQT
jgi:hypothetical protein